MFRTHHTLPRLGNRPIAPLSSWTQLRRAAATPRPKLVPIHAHWTEGDKLSLSERYPLSTELNAVLNPKVIEREGTETPFVQKVAAGLRARPKSGVHLRNQIVSPDLCDDILKYMAPSLEQHKGCDILDINPGACLWSQKLHEYLKPRSHILLEPNHNLFKQWIDPLVSAPESKYKLVTGNTLKLETWRDAVDTENFPHQTYKKPEDPNGQELNSTLLVTGFLAWDPLLPGFGFDSMAKQLYNHCSVAPWSNDIFNKFGPVRSLFWVGSEDFSRQIPQSLAQVQRASSLLALTQKMDIIARPTRSPDLYGKAALARDTQYEIESTLRALRRGEDAGIVIPRHRRDDSHDLADLLEEVTDGIGELSYLAMLELLAGKQRKGEDMSLYLGKSIVGVINKEQEFARDNPEYYVQPIFPLVSDTKEPATGKALDRDAMKKHRALRSAARGVVRTRIAIEEAGIINMEMMQLEWKLAKLQADSTEKSQIVKTIQDLDDRWHKIIDSQSKNYTGAHQNDFDDRVSLRCSPIPRIQWDARPFDPLVVRPDEVWPRTGMSLISSTPIPRPTSPDIPDYHEWILDFATGIYQDPRMTIPEALDSMQHSLSDIIKDCPSLTDGSKGGRLSMKHFRVRMLTTEMLEELTKAYLEWPFKAEGTAHSWYFRGKGRQMKKRRS